MLWSLDFVGAPHLGGEAQVSGLDEIAPRTRCDTSPLMGEVGRG